MTSKLVLLCAAVASAQTATEAVTEDYDPWQPFNERMFSFNHDVLDRWVLKPAATGWDKVLPDPAQRGRRGRRGGVARRGHKNQGALRSEMARS